MRSHARRRGRWAVQAEWRDRIFALVVCSSAAGNFPHHNWMSRRPLCIVLRFVCSMHGSAFTAPRFSTLQRALGSRSCKSDCLTLLMRCKVAICPILSLLRTTAPQASLARPPACIAVGQLVLCAAASRVRTSCPVETARRPSRLRRTRQWRRETATRLTRARSNLL